MAIVAQAVIDYLGAQGVTGLGNDWLPDRPDATWAIWQPDPETPDYLFACAPASIHTTIQALVRGGPKDYDTPYSRIQHLHGLLWDVTEWPATVVISGTPTLTVSLWVTLRSLSGVTVLDRDDQERIVFAANYEADVVWERTES